MLTNEGAGRFAASGTQPAPALPLDPTRVRRLSVTGMACPECLLRAGAGAIGLDGIAQVEVFLEQGHMVVVLEPGVTVTGDELVAAVREQGFGVELIPAVR